MSGNAVQYISPPLMSLVSAITINILSEECLGDDLVATDTLLGSATYTANLLTFVPLIVPEPTVVSQFFWHNGTATDAETDVGIYSEDGQTKLGSTGPTANSGTSQIQVVDVTNFLLAANQRYWLAIGSDSSSQTYWRANLIIPGLDFIGVKQQAAGWSTGLPATATLGIPTVAVLPWFGFTGGAI